MMSNKLEILQQRKEKLEREIAREKTKAKNAQKMLDDRKKILMGSFILDQLKKSNVDPAYFSYDGKQFSEWLTNSDDRNLFNVSSIN